MTCDVVVFDTGSESCVSSGSKTRGTACTATTQCAQGLTCQGGACRPYCATPNTACTGSGVGLCYAPLNDLGTTTPNNAVCAITCDVGNPSAACGTNTCVWFATEKESDCRTAGAGSLYDQCSASTDCGQGLACVHYAGLDDPIFGPYYECEEWCHLGSGSSECGFGTCTDIYGASAPTSGGVKMGHCQ